MAPPTRSAVRWLSSACRSRSIGVTPPDSSVADVGRAFDVALPLGAEPLVRGRDTGSTGRSTVAVGDGAVAAGQSLEAATRTLRARAAADPRGHGPRLAESRVPERPFTLLPAASGESALRRRYERPLVTHHGHRRARAADRVREHRQPAARPREGAASRAERSPRAGASRWRLVRQLLMKAWCSAARRRPRRCCSRIGAAGSWSHSSRRTTDRVFLDLSLDWRVLVFTARDDRAPRCSSARRRRSARPISSRSRRSRNTAAAPRRSRAAWQGLVVAQVALSLVLVVAAGLFVRTFTSLADLPLGFDPRSGLSSTSTHSAARSFRRIVSRLRTGPSAGAVRCRASQMPRSR